METYTIKHSIPLPAQLLIPLKIQHHEQVPHCTAIIIYDLVMPFVVLLSLEGGEGYFQRQGKVMS